MGTSMFDRGGQVLNHRRRVVRDDVFDWGVYAWRMPDGKVLGNDQGDMLNIPSMKGDITKQRMLQNYVNHELGIFKGEPYFMEGVMRLTEDEHQDQMQQMLEGKTPDLDIATLADDARAKKQREKHGEG